MDIERALLKAGVTVAAMSAIYQDTQGIQQLVKRRRIEARRNPELQLTGVSRRELATTLTPLDE